MVKSNSKLLNEKATLGSKKDTKLTLVFEVNPEGRVIDIFI
jgi:hypothetical protein